MIKSVYPNTNKHLMEQEATPKLSYLKARTFMVKTKILLGTLTTKNQNKTVLPFDNCALTRGHSPLKCSAAKVSSFNTNHLVPTLIF